MKKNYFILYILNCFLLLVLAQWFLLPKNDPYSSNLIKANIILVVISFLIFSCYEEKFFFLKNQTFRSIYLLLIGFFIVHYQIYLDYEFGNYNFFDRNYLIDISLLKDGVLISLAGFISMMIGYISSVLFTKNSRNNTNKYTYINEKTPFIIGIINIILLILLISTTNKSYFFGGYSIIERNYLSLQFETFLILSISSSIIASSYLIKNNNKKISLLEFIKKNSYLNTITTVIYLTLVITSGDRGPAISIILLLIGSFLYSQKIKLKLIPAFILILTFATAISTLGIIREVRNDNFLENLQTELKTKTIRESDYSISKPTHELAISIRSWHTALLYTREFDYKYGLIQLNQILSIIPGMGTIFRELTGLSSDDLKSATILTNYYRDHKGIGTTVVADIYLDFSIYGVIIILFLLGFFARNLDLKLSPNVTPSLIVWICSLILLSKSIYISRSSILVIFRDILLIYIEIIIINFFLKNFKIKI